MKEERPPRRLGSLGEYLQYLATRTALASFGGMVTLFGAVGAITTLVIVGGMFLRIENFFDFLCFLLAVSVTGGLSWLLLLFGWYAIKEAKEMPQVAPIRHDNVDLLPMEATLLRPSSEPVQPLENILLRPADTASLTLPEELLRAVE